jgi:N-acetylmuramoyl-L-alanine amidase
MIILLRKANAVLILCAFILTVLAYGLINLQNDTGPEPVTTTGQVQKTILIDPGHGGEDPGAVSPYSGFKEKDANLYISLKLRDLLQSAGYRVLMTREEDKLEYADGTTNVVKKRSQDLIRRKQFMDEGGADIVLSIHLNKIPETQYYGAQTFFPKNSPNSVKLAQCIQKSLIESVDPTNKREAIQKKEDIIILRNPRSVTVMVECGFLSNAAEEKKLFHLLIFHQCPYSQIPCDS